MRKVLLACVMAASLAGCSWMHRDRTESSGSTTPPAQAQTEQGTATSGNQAGMDWSKCDEHPYTPGPRTCK